MVEDVETAHGRAAESTLSPDEVKGAIDALGDEGTEPGSYKYATFVLLGALHLIYTIVFLMNGLIIEDSSSDPYGIFPLVWLAIYSIAVYSAMQLYWIIRIGWPFKDLSDTEHHQICCLTYNTFWKLIIWFYYEFTPFENYDLPLRSDKLFMIITRNVLYVIDGLGAGLMLFANAQAMRDSDAYNNATSPVMIGLASFRLVTILVMLWKYQWSRESFDIDKHVDRLRKAQVDSELTEEQLEELEELRENVLFLQRQNAQLQHRLDTVSEQMKSLLHESEMERKRLFAAFEEALREKEETDAAYLDEQSKMVEQALGATERREAELQARQGQIREKNERLNALEEEMKQSQNRLNSAMQAVANMSEQREELAKQKKEWEATMKQALDATMEQLKGAVIQLTVNDIPVYSKALLSMLGQKDQDALLKRAHAEVKRQIVQIKGEQRPGQAWSIAESDLSRLKEYQLKGLYKSLQEIVLAYDNMTDEAKNELTTAAELIANRKWLCILGERAVKFTKRERAMLEPGEETAERIAKRQNVLNRVVSVSEKAQADFVKKTGGSSRTLSKARSNVSAEGSPRRRVVKASSSVSGRGSNISKRNSGD